MGAVAEPPATIACSSRGGLSRNQEVNGVSEMRLDWGGVRTLKVILGVSWVISGRRYDDGPPPWGIMGVKETSP